MIKKGIEQKNQIFEPAVSISDVIKSFFKFKNERSAEAPHQVETTRTNQKI